LFGYYTGMTEILKLYKKEGETPLECLLRFKTGHSQYSKEKMTYLGRLDPMAEGLLLALAGNTKEREKYLSLDKTYEFEVLWGFSTDTHDILGIIDSTSSEPTKLEQRIPVILEKVKEKKSQVYPNFSSKSFGGDYMKAREAKIDELDRPEKKIKIFDIAHLNTRLVSNKGLLEEIKKRVSEVKGDFRQGEIIKKWAEVLEKEGSAMISSFKADVSSGTYIRGLAHEMGEMIDKKALAWSIRRTRIGNYSW